ncbi:MAG: M23 family metallopeptidase [Holophagales bacterium]|nr:M23 family metallopeptidase [Holophagales bacterium]
MRFSSLVLLASIVGLMPVYTSAKTPIPLKLTKTKTTVKKENATDDKPQPNKKDTETVVVQTKLVPPVKQVDALPPQQADDIEFLPQTKQLTSPLLTDVQNNDSLSKPRLDPAQFLASQVQGILPESNSEETVDFEPYIFLPADPNNFDLLWPVETRTISSAWGPRVRTSVTVVKTPYGNRQIRKPYNSIHKGIDLTAPIGHGIFAAMDGTVIAVGNNKKLGKFVRIDHGNDVETVYGHNSENLVEIGDMVRRGQIIAKVGSTGHSTGPHVHFEVLINKQQVNPAPLLNDSEEIPAEIIAYNDNFLSSNRNR